MLGRLRTVKSIMLALLISSLLLSVIAGCGKGNTQQSSETTSQTTTTNGTTTEPTTKDAPKPTLKILTNYVKDGLEEYPVTKYLEERTGYKIEYSYLPQDKPEDKLNLIMSTSEKYDWVNIAGNQLNYQLYLNYAKQGALVQLDQLFDEYGPRIKEGISEETWEIMKVDGKIYGATSKGARLQEDGSVMQCFIIRQDWLDKVGKKAPTTPDELVDVLKAFRDQDPGGNGNENIPWTIRSSGTSYTIAAAFGMYYEWDVVDGKVVPNILNPGFKDYVAYMNNLYKQKLIDQDFPVNKSATVQEKFTSGKAGMMEDAGYSMGPIIDALLKNKPDAKYAFLAPLYNKDGKRIMPGEGGIARIGFMPVSAEHKEDMVKYLNEKVEPETFRTMVIGEEGVHYKVENGRYTPILPKFNEDRNLAMQYLDVSIEKAYNEYWQARARKDLRNWEAIEMLNFKTDTTCVSDLLWFFPPVPKYYEKGPQLKQMVDDAIVNWVAGTEPLTSIDSFIQKWRDAGGAEAEKEINEWYASKK